jgi:ATP-dependent Clp protease ATP-binding subunit ClpA
VLLLDEIEKAHEDLFNILLQVMDHATLTDNNGKRADFRNTILMMTSNAGAREMSHSSIGFGDRSAATSGKGKEAIERLFTPEFRNRLDDTIGFNPLSVEIMERIVDKFIDELNGQLAGRKVNLQLSATARHWLARQGFDPVYGARPLGRLIQTKVKDVLSNEILFGCLQNGGRVAVDVIDDRLAFDYGEGKKTD